MLELVDRDDRAHVTLHAPVMLVTVSDTEVWAEQKAYAALCNVVEGIVTLEPLDVIAAEVLCCTKVKVPPPPPAVCGTNPNGKVGPCGDNAAGKTSAAKAKRISRFIAPLSNSA
jgi:hypothetical protein